MPFKLDIYTVISYVDTNTLLIIYNQKIKNNTLPEVKTLNENNHIYRTYGEVYTYDTVETLLTVSLVYGFRCEF